MKKASREGDVAMHQGAQSVMAWWLKAWLLVCCALVMLMGQAGAQTLVQNQITSDIVLRTGQSPYLMQGDVVVDADATLTIEPGVTIRMATGASFTLRKGALHAAGTAQQPIVITSDAPTPAPGDWRQWRLMPGTRSDQTRLEHVVIEYGSGVALENASPTILYSAFNHHSGPAIHIDLASSPVGVGNSAKGNSLNAIAVPAGTIRSHVVWGVVGIPYLVQQGLVRVGLAPLSIEPARLRLGPGVVALMRVALKLPAPQAGLTVDITSSVPSVASVASRVTVAAGQTSADLEVQANVLGTSLVTASHAALGLAEVQIEVVELPPLVLAPDHPTVGVNRPYAMRLLLQEPAPDGGLTVRLDNSDNKVLSAPPSLQIGAGRLGMDFEVTGLKDGSSRLSAEADGHASALATVSVRTKALVLPASLVVAPGKQATVSLEITEPAPEQGLLVNLAVEPPGLSRVVASLQIPPGQSRAAVMLDGQSQGSGRLVATANGYQPAEARLHVDSLNLGTDPAADVSMGIEQSRTLRVRLDKTAPAGGIAVSATSRDPAIARVAPAQIFIPEGQLIATTPVTVKGIAVGQAFVEITSAGLNTKVVKVDVHPKQGLRLKLDEGEKLVVGNGLYTDAGQLYVEHLTNGEASTVHEPLTVYLRCTSESCMTPASVTIPGGKSQAAIRVTGTGLGIAQIEAQAEGMAAAMPMPVEVVAPQLVFAGLDGQRTTESERDDFHVVLKVPGLPSSFVQRTAQPLAVDLDVVEQDPAGLIGGIYSGKTGDALITQLRIPGNTVESSTAYLAKPGSAGSYRVRAEVADIASAVSDVQTVKASDRGLMLHSMAGEKLVVGAGLGSGRSEFYVERLRNGAPDQGHEPLTVNIRCLEQAVCTTPSTLTIAAGQSRAYVGVAGTGVGVTQVVAEAGALTARPMPTEVVLPRLVFNRLDATRSTASGRDEFVLSLEVPGAAHDPEVDRPLTVEVSLVDRNPESVVQGIYNTQSDGSLISQITYPAGGASSNSGFVARPETAGSYRIRAEINGIASGVSELQIVTGGNQAVQISHTGGREKIVVGKGLKAYYSELSLNRMVNGESVPGEDALTVKLRCVSQEICMVPATVTIASGESSVDIEVVGKLAGKTQLEADFNGLKSYFPVEVVSPRPNINGLDESRLTTSARDDFYISLDVPGGYFPSYYYYSIESIDINAYLIEKSPPGIVEGIFSEASDGELISHLTISAGYSSSSSGHVGRPTSVGTYKIKFDGVGLETVVSDIQIVTAPELSLSLVLDEGSQLAVGKGLRSHQNELRVRYLINGNSGDAPQDMIVGLRCVDSNICSAPPSVKIEKGQGYADIRLIGLEVGFTQLEAEMPGLKGAAIPVEVVRPGLIFNYLDGQRRTNSALDDFSVLLMVPGGYWSTYQTAVQSMAVNVSLVEQQPAGLVGEITDELGGSVTQVFISEGERSSNIAYVGAAVTAGTYRVQAEIPGVLQAQSAVQTIVASRKVIELKSPRGNLIVGKGLRTYQSDYESELYVRRRIDGAPDSEGDLTVSLRCIAAQVCAVPATVTIPQGRSEAFVSVIGGDLGATEIEASAVGFEPGRVVMETVMPSLRLQSVPSVVSVGQQASAIHVTAEVANAYLPERQYPAQPLAVTFTSSVPSVGTVTGSVNWAAGTAASDPAVFIAVAPGDTQVTASAPGFTPAASKQITVRP